MLFKNTLNSIKDRIECLYNRYRIFTSVCFFFNSLAKGEMEDDGVGLETSARAAAFFNGGTTGAAVAGTPASALINIGVHDGPKDPIPSSAEQWMYGKGDGDGLLMEWKSQHKALVGGEIWYLRESRGCVSLLIRMQNKRVYVKEVLVSSGMLAVSLYTRRDFLSDPF